jgi:hypothetical protein
VVGWASRGPSDPQLELACGLLASAVINSSIPLKKLILHQTKKN